MSKEAGKASPQFVGIILALLVQAVVVITYFNNIENNSETNMASISKLEFRVDRLEQSVQSQQIAMARMEEMIISIKNMVSRIDKSIEQMK